MSTTRQNKETEPTGQPMPCVESRAHFTSFHVLWALLLANIGKVLILGIPAVGTATFGAFWLFSRASISDVQKLQERTDKEMNALREQTNKALQEHRDRTDSAIKRTNKAIQELRVALRDLRINIRKDISELLKEALDPLRERIRRNEQTLDAYRKKE